VMLLVMLSYDNWSLASLYDNPMYGPEGSTLLHFGAKFSPALLAHHQSWRLFVSCFLHSGIIHLVFSLGIAFMYLFSLEKEHGWLRVSTVFVVSGIFSQLFSALISPTVVSVGGAAALTGVVSSWLGDFVHSYNQIQLPWQYFIRNVISTAIVFAAGIFPFNDNWANFGAVIAGVVCGLAFYFPIHKSKRTGRWRVHHVKVWVPALALLVVMICTVCGALYGQSESDAYKSRGNAHWIACIDAPYWSCSAGVPDGCFSNGQLTSAASNFSGAASPAAASYC